MSTDTTQDGKDRRLPATWEEFQRARREAFLAGAKWGAGFLDDADRRQAAYFYPITKRVPRVVSDGRCEWRMVDGELEYRLLNLTWQRCGYNAERVRLFADLLANPNEEVES